jgi:arylsulfatase A-like enzyme
MSDRPNIVLIMTDQQRADFSRAEGYPLDPMPFIDSLGERGTRFGHAYTPMPTCGPARTSVMTGRYPKATRVRENRGLQNVMAMTDLPRTLREAGYSINIAGKNHSYLREADFDWASLYMHTGGGRADRRTAEDEAFDAWLDELDHSVYPEPSPYPLERQPPYRVVSDAMACLAERNREQPFFLWLSFAEPHNPYQVPAPYFGMFPEEEIPDRVAGPEAIAVKGEKWQWMRNLIESKRPGYDDGWKLFRSVYLGMIRLIDDQVRRFVEHLERTGELDNTVLIFMSDHGDYVGEYGLQRKGVGLPEALVRVPLLFAGPGIAAHEGLRDEFVSLVDVFPTLCEMLGLPIPDGVQGRSLWPMLTGDAFPAEEFRSVYSELGVGGIHYGVDERPPLHFPYEGHQFDCLNSVTQSGNLKMVRMGDWKLLLDSQGNGELYNLADDPAEVRNHFGDPAYAERQLALTTELLQWTIRTEDDLPGGTYVRKRPPRNWYAPMPEGATVGGGDA